MAKMDLEARISDKPHVTKEDIRTGLRELGLGEGDKVMVHSSLSSFGYVEPTDTPEDEAIVQAMSKDLDGDDSGAMEGLAHKVRGANTVIRALLEHVGHDGVVMMPSFNHGSVDIFDPLTTRSVSGIITNVFWRMPGVRRSIHPTHPYAAAGKDAEELLAGNDTSTTYGRDNPLGKLIYQGGHILFLGVGLGSCTAMHVGESVAGAKCLDPRGELGKVLKDGKVVYVLTDVWRESGECVIEHRALAEKVREANLMKDTTVGDAVLQLIDGRDLVNTVAELCKEYCFERCPIKPDYASSLKKLRDEILAVQEQWGIKYDSRGGKKRQS